MFTFPPRDEYRGPGISPSYYEDDPILLASMGDKRIKEARKSSEMFNSPPGTRIGDRGFPPTAMRMIPA